MDDDSFRQLLARLGLSWEGYAKVRKGVKKRILRHMRELGLQTVEDYLQALEHPVILREAEKLMAVSISRFFRDRHLWRTLEEEIIPEIIARRTEEVHVWSAGCATGQEAYSLVIAWDMLKKGFPLPGLRILATDINPDYIAKAMGGVYGRSSLKGLPGAIKTGYFHICQDGLSYCVADNLRKYILWEVHDLVREEPPQEKFQVIFLRNSIFTYCSAGLRAAVFLKVMKSLDEGGFFIIGSHEMLPSPTCALSPFKGSSYIYQKT